MREILFRGKRIDNGEWAVGYYGLFKGRSDIYVPFTEKEEKENEGHIFSAIGGLWNRVSPETVGQFTGLTDEDGEKIFEDDIVCCFRSGPDRGKICGYITYTEGCFCVHDIKSINQPAMDLCSDYMIIGNIHDHPELLEV